MSENKPGAAQSTDVTERRYAVSGELQELLGSPEVGVVLILVVLSLFLGLTTTTFLVPTTLSNVVRYFSWIAIAAFGETMVILTAGIDLSVGSVMGLAGIITGLMFRAGMDMPTSILAGLATGAIVGLFNGMEASECSHTPSVPAFLAGVFATIGAAVILLRSTTASLPLVVIIAIGQALEAGIIAYLVFGGRLGEAVHSRQVQVALGVVAVLLVGSLILTMPYGNNGLLIVGLTLAIGALIGVNARILIPPFIATLGMLSVARGLCQGLTGGWPVQDLPDAFRYFGQHDIIIGAWPIPLPFVIMLALAVFCWLFLTRTVWGRHIYSTGGNAQATALAGVNTDRVRLLVYTLSGLFAAIGGLLMSSYLGVAAPLAGLGYELNVIAAVVIGGTSLFGGEGTIWGTLMGGAIMQVLSTGLNLLGVSAYWQETASGAVIILAVKLDQWRKSRRRYRI
jgi:ribose transport system permease protein